MRNDTPAERWAIANAGRYTLPALLDPFTDSFIQELWSDTEGGVEVCIPPSEEHQTKFVCQLAYLSGWIVTDVTFAGHCIRFQDPTRFEELSKDRWSQSTRNGKFAPDWDDVSDLEDYFDEP